jgi:hypothetical protein
MNATLLQSRFHVIGAQRDIALEALREWARTYRSIPVAERFVHDYSQIFIVDLPAAIEVLGYDVVEDGEGNIVGIVQNDCDTVSPDHRQAMRSMAGAVEPTSYMVFHDEDGSVFRWRWGLNEFNVDEAVAITFATGPGIVLLPKSR